MWDLAGGRAPLSPFWTAAAELRSGVVGESGFAGAREGHLRELFEEARLRDVEEVTLSSAVEFASFDEWWEPYTLGVGPAGAYAQKLDPAELAELRERCRAHLPEAPFTQTSVAWAARGTSDNGRRGLRR